MGTAEPLVCTGRGIEPVLVGVSGRARVFENLEDWEVRAVRGGQALSAGLFRQSYPMDAVVQLMGLVRIKHDVPSSGWGTWKFWCISRDSGARPQHTMVFDILPGGRPLLLADSRLGGLLQSVAGAPD